MVYATCHAGFGDVRCSAGDADRLVQVANGAGSGGAAGGGVAAGCGRVGQLSDRRGGAEGAGPEADDPAGEDRRDRWVDKEFHPGRGDALVVSIDGREGRGVQGHRAAGVVRAGFETTSVKTLKLSNDPLFEEKLIDVVGL